MFLILSLGLLAKQLKRVHSQVINYAKNLASGANYW